MALKKTKIDKNIHLSAKTTNVNDGEKLKLKLRLLDENKQELAIKEETVPVENKEVKYNFTVQKLATDLSKNINEISYIAGWIDLDGDGILDYDEEVIIEVEGDKPEILYDVKTKELLLVFGKDLEELYKESHLVNKCLRPLEHIRENKNNTQEQIKEAKEVSQELLAKINISDLNASQLTELIRLNGKKFTYIRSNKMKNHWRKYSLKADDKNRSKLMTDGSLDKDKIIEAFKPSIETTKTKISYDLLKDSENLKNFTNWVNLFTNAGEISEEFRKDIEDKDLSWNASAEATWLRFTTGASLKAVNTLGDMKEGKFAFSCESNSEFALAKGELKANGYIPNKAGWNVKLPNKSREGIPKKDVDLGHIRVDTKTTVQGFAGVNLALSANLNFEMSKNGKLTLTKPKTQTSTKADLFAGVKITCGLEAGLLWKNPENRNDFSLFAKVGYGGSAALGLGLEGEFIIDYNLGKFIIRAKAGVVCGVGASGEVGFEVDANTIMEFVVFIYHRLRDDNFTYLEYITPIAFEYLTVLILSTIQNIENNLKLEYKKLKFTLIDNFWLKLFPDLSGQKDLALSIIKGEQDNLLKFSSPEVKGALIYYLSETSLSRTEETQERAVIYILENFVTSKREALKVITSISEDGTKVSENKGETRIYKILDSFIIRSDFLHYGYNGVEAYRTWRAGLERGHLKGKKVYKRWQSSLKYNAVNKKDIVLTSTNLIFKNQNDFRYV